MRVQRCPCITDMRSAYCVVSVFSLQAPSGGRQRTSANQIFTRLLRSYAAEKDAVRIPQTRSRLTIFKPFGHALKIRAFQTNKNLRMYSDRMCKTKASSTQGSFCKPINLIFLRRQRRFFHFFAAGSSGNSACSILRSAVLGTVIFFRGNKHTRNGVQCLPVVEKARPALAAVGCEAFGKFAFFQLTNYIILLTVR